MIGCHPRRSALCEQNYSKSIVPRARIRRRTDSALAIRPVLLRLRTCTVYYRHPSSCTLTSHDAPRTTVQSFTHTYGQSDLLLVLYCTVLYSTSGLQTTDITTHYRYCTYTSVPRLLMINRLHSVLRAVSVSSTAKLITVTVYVVLMSFAAANIRRRDQCNLYINTTRL